MGTVFKARWERSGKDVAVKLLRGEKLTSAEFEAATAALERETEKLRLASNSGFNTYVVAQLGLARGAPSEAWRGRLGDKLALYTRRDDGASAGAGGAGELLGLVMVWQPGGSLADRLHGSLADRQRGVAVRWAARTPVRLLLLERAAEGVALLHSTKPQLIVHGDIKSENVLLTAKDEPRLSDFGISEIKQAATTSQGSVAAASDTNRDKASGTWQYMAPELYKRRDVLAQNVSPQTDVYALATLCWEVLVGERPWAGATEADRLADIRDGANLDFARLPGDVPAELRALLERGMSLDREARPSARELCEGLCKARKRRFDVFLSHAWEGNEHAPATTFLLHAMRREGRHVWVDKEQLGHAMGTSMREGIAASAVFVALVSRKYAASKNCMLELREARDSGKPFVSCLVEPDEKWWPPSSATTDEERELAAAVNTRDFMFADLRTACAAGGWADPMPAGLLKLLDAPAAAPMLLKLVDDELGAKCEADLSKLFIEKKCEADLSEIGFDFLYEYDGRQLLVACKEERAEDALRLMYEGAYVNFVGEDGETPLIAASAKGLDALATRLVEAGAKLELVDANGVSALTWASNEGHTAIVQLLAEKGAKLDIVDKYGRSALMKACFWGHAATAQFLAECMDASALNLVDFAGRSALDYSNEGGYKNKVAELASAAAAIRMRGGLTGAELEELPKKLYHACKEGRAEDALTFIKKGVDVDFHVFYEDGGRSPLIWASEKGLETLATRLVKAGASLDYVDIDGQSALMHASSEGHTAVVQMLADSGAQLDLFDRRGHSALIGAAYSGCSATAQLLAAQMDAAALNLIDKDGKTALDHANEGGKNNDKLAELAPAAAAIRARGGLTAAERKARAGLPRPALPAAKMRTMGKQLLMLCNAGMTENALLLIKEGADVNFCSEHGRTPLIAASAMGLEAVVARLVEAGAALDLADEEGWSALMPASNQGHTAIVQLLIEKGAKLDLVDKYGRSALMSAFLYGHAATAQLLSSRMNVAALNLVSIGGKTALDWADVLGWAKDKVSELAPVADAIRARGGLTAAELEAQRK